MTERKAVKEETFTGLQWRNHMTSVQSYQARVQKETDELVARAIVLAKEANARNEWIAYVMAANVSTDAILASAKTLAASPYHFRVTAPSYSRTITERAEMSDFMETRVVKENGLMLEPSA